jgi:ATPase family associated with various cellular activities (AAA)
MSAVQISAMPENPASQMSWGQANQTCLVMEFARLRRKLDAASGGPDISTAAADEQRIDASLREFRESLDPPSAIDQLSSAFGLSPFEREIILLCAGIEMDSTLASQCNDAMGHDRRELIGAINFSLALAMLDNPHWSALAPSGALRRCRLVELESGHGLTSAPLRIDERILHYLAGVNHLDSRLEALVLRRRYPLCMAKEHSDIAAQAVESFDGIDAAWMAAPVLHLCGDDPRGQEDVAAVVARQAGRELYILPVENFPIASPAEVDARPSEAASFVELWGREVALLPAILLVQIGAGSPNASARQMMERLPAPLIVASRDPLRLDRRLLRYTVNKPRPASQKHLWTKALGAACTSLNGHLDNVSEQFRLSAETIFTVGASSISGNGTVNRSVDPDKLWSACRSLSRPRLEDLAERILPSAAWDDLILPEAQKQVLRQLSSQARYRMTVYEHWGFAANGRRGLGITALFAGASGTGKTLAAEVLAKELRLDLYRIDLSAVVSKYIGESEKNLKQVFDAAEEGGVVLLFDEADALFGKRAEVKDSHDRYANIEVSYLLQRMESFQGLAVLTTNLKSSLDKAFQRRLRFTVDFPFPGALEREAIWQRVFPAQTPTVGLDMKRLAQLNMTGGNIRNIALNAAFLAAEAGTPIGMRHVLHATRQEAIKTERPLSDGEIRGWA